MKGKRISEIMFIAFAGLFIAAVVIITLATPQGGFSYFENRSLQNMPEMEKDSLLDGSYFTTMEKFLTDNGAGRTTLLKLKTAYKLFINIKLLNCPVVNDVVVLPDVLLPFNPYETINMETIESQSQSMAENLSEITDLTESYGGKFMYVTVPCQYVSYESRYPWYLNSRREYTEASREALYNALEGSGVTVVDMYDTLTDAEIRNTVNSTVDNHYSIYGAYLTYLAVMEKINETERVHILTEDEFTITPLPNHYVGSRSRKLFDISDVYDTIDILTPKVEIPFSRYDNGKQVAPTVYSMPSNQYEGVLYSLYMGGDIGETVIDTGREELPKILIYGDSFTNAFESIAYYSFGEMRSLDFRHYTEMTLGQYIEMYKPDYVVCIRDYEQLISTSANGCGID